ncbi:MAG: hypothetical protein ACE5DS_07210 [Kiloniellaceae bacterium]
MDTREAMAGIARAVEVAAVGCPFFNRCPLAVEGTCDREAAALGAGQRHAGPQHRLP